LAGGDFHLEGKIMRRCAVGRLKVLFTTGYTGNAIVHTVVSIPRSDDRKAVLRHATRRDGPRGASFAANESRAAAQHALTDLITGRSGAGEGNRTLVISLEGGCFETKICFLSISYGVPVSF
jgi:hypothetical protein